MLENKMSQKYAWVVTRSLQQAMNIVCMYEYMYEYVVLKNTRSR